MLPRQEIIQRQTGRAVQELGDNLAVQRFLNKYGKGTTRRVYALPIAYHAGWLKARASHSP